MSKPIQYRDGPIGEVRLIPDFLPSPEELALRSEQTQVTISLSSESVAYFKQATKKHHMQLSGSSYQGAGGRGQGAVILTPDS